MIEEIKTVVLLTLRAHKVPRLQHGIFKGVSNASNVDAQAPLHAWRQ